LGGSPRRLLYGAGPAEVVGWAARGAPAPGPAPLRVRIGRGRGERAATGPTVGAGRARAVPRAWGAAQVRLAPSGRASPGLLATGPGRAWAGPKKRAPCRANGLGLHGQLYL